MVAPDRERSGTGHSITVFEPIKVVPNNFPGIKASWTVGGTPVDCVKLAVNRLIDEPVDLVVSGINHGPNLARMSSIPVLYPPPPKECYWASLP